jgi:hypothetical protein
MMDVVDGEQNQIRSQMRGCKAYRRTIPGNSLEEEYHNEFR